MISFARLIFLTPGKGSAKSLRIVFFSLIGFIFLSMIKFDHMHTKNNDTGAIEIKGMAPYLQVLLQVRL